MNPRLAGAAAIVVLGVLAPPALATPITDVSGDAVAGAFRTYDITSIDATFTATDLIFTVALSTQPFAPSAAGNTGIYGFIDIDVDNMRLTGAMSNIDAAGAVFPGFGSSGLGMEFYVNLFSEAATPGFVDVRNPFTATSVGSAPITYGASSFSVVVPLGLLGPDDGFVNYAVLVGDLGSPTDQARDPGFVLAGGLPASSSPTPSVPAAEPSTGLLVALGISIMLRRGRAVSLRLQQRIRIGL